MNITISDKFFAGHPDEFQPTGFEDKVKELSKIHTCRLNLNFWEKVIARLKEQEKPLNIRQWVGKPYALGSTMRQIKKICPDALGVQDLWLILRPTSSKSDKHPANIYDDKWTLEGWIVNGKNINEGIAVHRVDLNRVAKNDGLTSLQYLYWFLPALTKAKEQQIHCGIIHFTNFRY